MLTEAKAPAEAVRFWEYVRRKITGAKADRLIVEPSFLSRAGEFLAHPNAWPSFVDVLIKIMGGISPNEWTKQLHNNWRQTHLSGKFYLVYYPRRDRKVILMYLGSSSEIKDPMNALPKYVDATVEPSTPRPVRTPAEK